MTRWLSALGLVGILAGAGCVFTSRPSLPATPDGGGATRLDEDAGMIAGGGTDDAGTAPTGADAGDHGGLDDTCTAVVRGDGGGDAGYRDPNGHPCDPTASARGDGGTDGGRTDVGDARADVGDVTDAGDTGPGVVGDVGRDVGRDVGEAGDRGVTVDAPIDSTAGGGW